MLAFYKSSTKKKQQNVRKKKKKISPRMCIETVNIAFQACLFISLNFSKELMLK